MMSATGPGWLTRVGQFQWIRAHISLFAVGGVLLICANLLIGGHSIWSLTVLGIWSLLLLVHGILIIISRLTSVLLTDIDEEEVVLLPIQDAVISAVPSEVMRVEPVEVADTNIPEPTTSIPESETVSWQIATDAARLHRPSGEEEP